MTTPWCHTLGTANSTACQGDFSRGHKWACRKWARGQYQSRSPLCLRLSLGPASSSNNSLPGPR